MRDRPAGTTGLSYAGNFHAGRPGGTHMDQSAFWALRAPLTDGTQQSLMDVQLQLQLAEHQALQNRTDGVFNTAAALPAFPGLNMPQNAALTPQETVWPATTIGTLPSNSGIQTCTVPLGDWQDSTPRGQMGFDEGLQQYLPVAGHLLRSRTSQADAQMLAIERLRREMGRVQAELDRAEREVIRQKSLRETERLEFTEAKERLKHSWANDREDFARVKTTLKTKNAEHHAQSGRLSQQLKDCEACNRGLRDLMGRNGIAVPIELESSQIKRISGHTSLPLYGIKDSGKDAPQGSSVSHSSDPNIPYGRSSLDSLVRNSMARHEALNVPKSQSLPDDFSSQTILCSSDELNAHRPIPSSESLVPG